MRFMQRKILYILILVFVFLSVKGVGNSAEPVYGECPTTKVEVERLPDMHHARSGHILLRTGDEVLAIGGHTDGFVPTSTAEYYKDGEWHVLETVYPHDNGFGVVLKSGKVLIGGGHELSLGIGQTFPVELYDPQTHTFKGFSCLDTRRALCRAVELDSGKVVIAGNHYNDDSFELFDGKKLFTKAGDVSEKRCAPWLLRSGRMDAVVFGKQDEKMRKTESIRLDRLSGGSCEIELLREWTPFMFDTPVSSDICFIGDETRGDYRYLIAGEKKDGSLEVVCVEDTVFTPIRTATPIPYSYEGEQIKYRSAAIVDRTHKRCYVRGRDAKNRLYLLCLFYNSPDAARGVPVRLYVTDPLPYAGYPTPIVTENGDLLFAGGITDSNFSPFKSTFLVKTGEQESSGLNLLPIWLTAGGLCLVVAGGMIWRRRRRHTKKQQAEEQATALAMKDNIAEENTAGAEGSATAAAEPPSVETDASDQLLSQIRSLMEGQQLFLNNELKLADVAKALGTNSSYVSSCIRTKLGYSFSQFVNRYRVDYAKQQMIQRQGEKLSSIGLESGFSNETSFFRAFKAVTGMTPGEWLGSLGDS